MQDSQPIVNEASEMSRTLPASETPFRRLPRINNAQLVAELDALGVYFLCGARAIVPTGRLTPDQLLAQLASSDEARVRLALIPLLLHRPDFAAYVRKAVQIAPDSQIFLKCYYTATFYLQRKYRLRLEKLMEKYRSLPDLFSEDLELHTVSDPDVGLRMLARRHALLSGKPINWLGTYEHAAQRWLRHKEKRQLWNI